MWTWLKLPLRTAWIQDLLMLRTLRSLRKQLLAAFSTDLELMKRPS